MKAKLRTNIRRANGEVAMEWRAGSKGTGKYLWGCTYWPDSARSVDEAYRLAEQYRIDWGIESYGHADGSELIEEDTI